MHIVFALARLFPYWALVVAFGLIEFGVFCKRRGRTGPQWACWIGGGIFVVLILAWFWGRGDLNADRWVREWFLS